MPRKTWATDKIDFERERAYWDWLRSHLPEVEVAKAFPNEESCLSRMITVRWAAGVTCPRCLCQNLLWLRVHKVWQCRECRRQFSYTSETVLKSTNLELRPWFLATEHMIRHTPVFVHDLMPSVSEFVVLTKLERKAAGRLRRKVFNDLRRDGGHCFLAGLVLTRLPQWPDAAPPGTVEFKAWLLAEAAAHAVSRRC
ncbi:transposase [Pseudogemmobacter sonorensis]|uniref:transposase n=1 Tax=Pseudogemmobacter sonorensis TaxID=2989681 RepID=UPI003F6808B6